MSRTKTKDFAAFANDLDVAVGQTTPVPVPGPAPVENTHTGTGTDTDTKRKPGRPYSGNEQITLRLDPRVREKLVQRVAAELQETGRMTTIQAVINQILIKELKIG
ncbi:hypothetical protein GGE65_007741 [Skermanella aerolata]|uniref:hypothetical protein n=1 Tax=Skermanella aerolata TaxID=393310 RepID=UPI003D19711D